MTDHEAIRTYDKDGFRLRAACLCVKDEKEEEVLLVSSFQMTDHWIVPGGGVDPGEESSAAAIREVLEEAGVKGKLGRFLGTFDDPERKHRTSVYLLIVTEILDEYDELVRGRKRKWFSVDEAHNMLSAYKSLQCLYLEKLKKNINL